MHVMNQWLTLIPVAHLRRAKENDFLKITVAPKNQQKILSNESKPKRREKKRQESRISRVICESETTRSVIVRRGRGQARLSRNSLVCQIELIDDDDHDAQ